VAINDPWPSIDPGGFRHLVTLLQATASSDASGAITVWSAGSPPVTAWCKIEFLRGDELVKSGQDVSQQFIKVTAWWRAAFIATQRLSWQGNQYIIQAVENVSGMNTYMVLLCLGVGANN